MKVIKIRGFYSDLGRIEVPGGSFITSIDLTGNSSLPIPFGSSLEISISFEEQDFLSGGSGIVWASYDRRQIEIIKNALSAQNIATETKEKDLVNRKIYLLTADSKNEIRDAVNFIWKGKAGLRLKPDWTYPDGQSNISFEKWLDEN